MKRKTKGSVTASIALFVTSGMLASFLGLRQYERATTVQTWVSNIPLEAGQVITGNLLERVRLDEDEAGIMNTDQLLGKRLRVSKAAGEAFRPGELEVQQRKIQKDSLSKHVPTGRVLFSLALSKASELPLSQLNAGDRLDVLVRGRRGVRTAATDVRLIGIMKPRRPGARENSREGVAGLLPQQSPRKAGGPKQSTLILAVAPGDVYPLAHIGTTESVRLVLHSAMDVAAGNPVSVTPEQRKRSVEVVFGLSRSSVLVSN